MKQGFGWFEAVFDVLYLFIALVVGFILILTSTDDSLRLWAGAAALVLAGGDSFHLVPRISSITSTKEKNRQAALGRGKQITSITMTLFYLLLWQLGQMIAAPAGSFITSLVWLMALVRIFLCLLKQNRWQEPFPPINWTIYRNLPFFVLGLITAVRFYLIRHAAAGLSLLWLAILLSFIFYLPVILWSGKNPKIGMFMLPKTCAYVWILVMFLWL